MAKGTVDIVVGTHAVLAKGVKFANLGLLVIDEEQHFGVGTRSGSRSCGRTSTC
jgi:transcription-repair coupling factor (superfamily II helicase)